MVNYGEDLEYGVKVETPQKNHTTKIYAKCYFTDKLFNYKLILGREILHEQGTIFNLVSKTSTWHEASTKHQLLQKTFFVIIEN